MAKSLSGKSVNGKSLSGKSLSGKSLKSAAPESMTIRSYNVGFGDCFLVSFRYGPKSERHVLIDYGSTGLPKGVPQSRMMDIALDIEKRTGGKLHAVVATHRHRDHISGFATKANGKGTGDVIRRLKPVCVVQPWTEDPDLETTATGPNKALRNKHRRFGPGTPRHLAALNFMHKFAGHMVAEVKRSRALSPPQRRQLAFMGETNLKNLSAVRNLMTMAENRYVHTGSKSGLEAVLPGVTIDVLGPPTVRQDASIQKQRHKDPDEFWHLQAAATRVALHAQDATLLFPRHIRSSGPRFPIESRWLIYHARMSRAQQLLSLVRMLDTTLNNTSVILLFQVGGKRILFPGDAQIENWRFALNQPKYVTLLKSVTLYKVGHHGSLNATPKSLWTLFKHRSPRKRDADRLISLLSTMEGKHGTETSHTEVPRRTLVNALARESEHFTTQTLTSRHFFRDVTVAF
jgi:hypothetical protein